MLLNVMLNVMLKQFIYEEVCYLAGVHRAGLLDTCVKVDYCDKIYWPIERKFLIIICYYYYFYQNISSLKGSYLNGGRGEEGACHYFLGSWFGGQNFLDTHMKKGQHFWAIVFYIVTAPSSSVINDHSLKS